jgi:hypothetical protein
MSRIYLSFEVEAPLAARKRVERVQKVINKKAI